jgi:hypothetical protein
LQCTTVLFFTSGPIFLELSVIFGRQAKYDNLKPVLPGAREGVWLRRSEELDNTEEVGFEARMEA